MKKNYNCGDWVQLHHMGNVYYARLLGLMPDYNVMVIYTYEPDNMTSSWTTVPMDIFNDFRLRKLSYKEINMIPSIVQLGSYVFNEDWIQYSRTNFDLREI